MLQIDIHVDDKHLKKLLSEFAQAKFYVLGKLRHDISRLGHDCYKLFLKTFIPVSHLNRPHLRDSFKVRTSIIHPASVYLEIYSDLEYAFFADIDAFVPTRFPRTRRAMKWTTPLGETVFAKRAKGFYKPGIHFTYFGEMWLTENFTRYVDITLDRYLFEE